MKRNWPLAAVASLSTARRGRYLLPLGVLGVSAASVWFALAPEPRRQLLTHWEGASAILAAGLAVLICAVWFSREASHAQAVLVGERRFETLFEEAGDALVLLDSEGRIRRVNRRAAELYCRTPEALATMTIEDLRLPEARLEARAQLQKAVMEGQITFETLHQRSNGTVFPVEVVSRRIEMGDATWLLSVVRDVTERHRQAQRLALQHAVLDGIMNSSESPIFATDLEHRYLAFNRGHADVMRALYGVEIEVGQTILGSMNVAEDEVHARRNLERALAGEAFVAEAYSGDEARIRSYFEISHNPIRDQAGRVTGVAVFARDVTRRRVSEELASQSHEKFVKAFQAIPDPAVITRVRDGLIVDANRTFDEVFGPAGGRSLGRTSLDLGIWIDDANRVVVVKALEAEGSLRDFECKLRGRGGKEIDCLISVSTLSLSDELHALSVIRDVSDRRRSELALAQSEANYRRLHESMMDAFVRVDMSGTIVESNRVYREMVGYTEEELARLTYVDLTPERWHALEARIIEEEILARGYSSVYEKEYVHRDGHAFPVELRTFLLRDERGGPSAMWAIVRDISDRREVERSVREMNETLEERVRVRTSEIEAANRDLEAFSYSVSHDLKAPLRAIDGFSRILEQDHASCLDSEATRLLERIRENARQMAQLVEGLLTFSRAGRREICRSPLDMNALVRSVSEELATQVETGRLELAVGDLPDAFGDGAALRQVLVNLMGNAVKFSAPKGRSRVVVAGSREAGRVIYSVADNGVGFDQRYAHKLFTVFERLHSQSEFPGSGVGLAIVQRIIERHGGEVWAEGRVGEGATVWFSLPVIDVEVGP